MSDVFCVPRMPRVSIRFLLLCTSALTLLAPVFLLIGLRAYNVVLMRDTEDKLTAEAVVIGESYREALRQEGIDPGRIAPPGGELTVAPWEPRITRNTPVGEPLAAPPIAHIASDAALLRAGARVQPMLRRARTFNLSGARVLDGNGTVIASSDGRDVGASLMNAPEVRSAVAGTYGVAARRREIPGPAPSLGSLSRQGRVHVFVAIPVFSDGQVVGVVRMARTSVTTLEHLWKNRRGLLAFVALCALCIVALSLAAYRAVVGPVVRVTQKATAIARGENEGAIAAPGWAPSEVVDLTLALDQMRDQLRARGDYVAEFAASAAHELRTPLTAIGGATELLRESAAEMSDAQRNKFLSNIQADVQRMNRLVGRLLTLAKLDNPRAGEVTALTELANFFDDLKHRYPAVVFTIHSHPSSLAYDEEHLRSAIVNLLENALRHGQHVSANVAMAGTTSTRIKVDVIDDGPGIPKAHQPRILERFYTTERDRGGNGLGLSIVRAVAESQGGSLHFTSEPQHTVFTLIL